MRSPGPAEFSAFWTLSPGDRYFAVPVLCAIGDGMADGAACACAAEPRQAAAARGSDAWTSLPRCVLLRSARRRDVLRMVHVSDRISRAESRGWRAGRPAGKDRNWG